MLGAVAVGYFFAAAFVMAVACSGPDLRARFVSAYLMCAWALTNFISTRHAPDEALGELSPYDLTAAMVLYIVMLRWPSRWLALVLAAVTTQVVFQVRHAFLDPGQRSIVASHGVNEAMYVVQLAAVMIPTIAHILRRQGTRRGTKPRAKIPPPYNGWTPPVGPAVQTPPHEPWRPDETVQG